MLLTNLNLYSNSFDRQLFPIYFHSKLHKNANNFESFKKARMEFIRYGKLQIVTDKSTQIYNPTINPLCILVEMKQRIIYLSSFCLRTQVYKNICSRDVGQRNLRSCRGWGYKNPRQILQHEVLVHLFTPSISSSYQFQLQCT